MNLIIFILVITSDSSSFLVIFSLYKIKRNTKFIHVFYGSKKVKYEKNIDKKQQKNGRLR